MGRLGVVVVVEGPPMLGPMWSEESKSGPAAGWQCFRYPLKFLWPSLLSLNSLVCVCDIDIRLGCNYHIKME